MLYDAIFPATCLTTLEKEICCKLQETCYTLQNRAITHVAMSGCNFHWFQKNLCNRCSWCYTVQVSFHLVHLCCNGVVRHVAGSRLQRVKPWRNWLTLLGKHYCLFLSQTKTIVFGKQCWSVWPGLNMPC